MLFFHYLLLLKLLLVVASFKAFQLFSSIFNGLVFRYSISLLRDELVGFVQLIQHCIFALIFQELVHNIVELVDIMDASHVFLRPSLSQLLIFVHFHRLFKLLVEDFIGHLRRITLLGEQSHLFFLFQESLKIKDKILLYLAHSTLCFELVEDPPAQGWQEVPVFILVCQQLIDNFGRFHRVRVDMNRLLLPLSFPFLLFFLITALFVGKEAFQHRRIHILGCFIFVYFDYIPLFV
mmetsp:Transcript_49351/g.127231  ORF Transcript_49351/g.127231 Transcript_49351/m.127231 type:complete len:236 (+) Transcript_49351:445-1152(+)